MVAVVRGIFDFCSNADHFRNDKNAARGVNKYTVTLFDLTTWLPVDVVVDERLAARPDGDGLLGCSPSEDGELWPCYVEKGTGRTAWRLPSVPRTK